jgi:protein-S-isoprenylcysteine O-methyltransferase Ste14
MNKSSNPNRIRRIATTAAGFVISVIGICAVAPSAFAMRVIPPQGATSAVHHSGTPGWEIALIVVAVAVIGLGLLATIARHTAAKRQGTALAARRAVSTGSLSRAAG